MRLPQGLGGALLAIASIAVPGFLIYRFAGPGAGAKKAPTVPTKPAISPTAHLPASNDASLSRLPAFIGRAKKLWAEATGESSPPSEAALQAVSAISHLEAGISDDTGGWWKVGTPMEGSHNKGSIQLTYNQVHNGAKIPPYYKGVTQTDHDGNGKEYTTLFRYYLDAPAPDGTMRSAEDWSVFDFLHQLSHGLDGMGGGAMWTAIRDGQSASEIAAGMKSKGYFAAPVGEYAKAIFSHVASHAQALGQEPQIAFAPPSVAGLAAELHAEGGAPHADTRARHYPDGRVVWYVPQHLAHNDIDAATA